MEGPYGLVLVAVKASSLLQALEDLAPAVGPDTLLVPLLNGMAHFEFLDRRFDPTQVMGGLCRINAMVDAQGRILHMSPLAELWYGERGGGFSDRTKNLETVLGTAGFDALATGDIGAKLWEKWTLLATIGGITCLMDGPLGDVARAPGGQAFALAFFEEILRVVGAVGQRPGHG